MHYTPSQTIRIEPKGHYKEHYTPQHTVEVCWEPGPNFDGSILIGSCHYIIHSRYGYRIGEQS